MNVEQRGVEVECATGIVAIVVMGPGSGAVRSQAGTTVTSICPDAKAGSTVGCWQEPPGYTVAPKTGGFVPIQVPAVSSGNVPAGTISNELFGPLSSEMYDTNNGWWNETDTTIYDAYAGSFGSDHLQGVVVVFASPRNDITQTGPVSLRAFPTASQDGALTIESADGWILTLQAGDGTTYTFDVATDRAIRIELAEQGKLGSIHERRKLLPTVMLVQAEVPTDYTPVSSQGRTRVH